MAERLERSAHGALSQRLAVEVLARGAVLALGECRQPRLHVRARKLARLDRSAALGLVVDVLQHLVVVVLHGRLPDVVAVLVPRHPGVGHREPCR